MVFASGELGLGWSYTFFFTTVPAGWLAFNLKTCLTTLTCGKVCFWLVSFTFEMCGDSPNSRSVPSHCCFR